MKILKLLFKILFTLLKMLFCFLVTLIVSHFVFIVNIGVFVDKTFNLQILLFDIISILSIIAVWAVSFMKIKKRTVIIYTLIFFVWLTSLNLFSAVKWQIDRDICIDSGDCAGVYKDK